MYEGVGESQPGCRHSYEDIISPLATSTKTEPSYSRNTVVSMGNHHQRKSNTIPTTAADRSS